ncbi:probable low-specificity L-threonine aldolase 2 isoform X2 [Sphaerodactylus townsendi]|uniref:probable low-specificity L-threonine aldolase 2 isoform X2 n=1 Tax=Sphaerodactylus townsendi TaxID=933632 RepID=UPI002025CFCD|nr:probable low-specificity L-threonine aldolase 2 isoform X2 [Sphaerodactylus townsendi]
MLLLSGKVGSWGSGALRKDLRALLCSCRAHVASQGKVDRGIGSPTHCREFRDRGRQSTRWCRGLGGTTTPYWHPGVGTTRNLAYRCCYEFKGRPIGHELQCRYQEVSACLTLSECCQQGVGALWIQKNQNQAFNGTLAHPNSKWQSISAIPKRSWLSRIDARCHSQTVASQHGTLLPWWRPRHAAFAPACRIGAHSYRTGPLAEAEHHVVDLRSDTVTRPSSEMRQAMAQAEVGDDDYGEDPTVNELQSLVADLLGKEEALFVPTATMANLIAVMCHCRRRGAQLLLGREAHIHIFEHGGVAQVAGVHSETLQDLPDGTISLDELEHKIQQTYRSQYHPRPELICLENTHCSAGGRILPLQYLQEVHKLAHQYELKIHLDGARMLNAAVALGVLPNQITQHCDSVTLCLSKGVGAPAGALLAGQREFIVEAWRVRKLLGGGMRQAGVLAAAALVGLRHMEEILQRDHTNARSFAEGACLGRRRGDQASFSAASAPFRSLQPWISTLLCKPSLCGDQYRHDDNASTLARSCQTM